MRPRRTIFAVALRRQLREFRKDRDRVHNFLLRLTSIIVLGVVAQWSAWRSRIPSICRSLGETVISVGGAKYRMSNDECRNYRTRPKVD
jgi:hypothetical protein